MILNNGILRSRIGCWALCVPLSAVMFWTTPGCSPVASENKNDNASDNEGLCATNDDCSSTEFCQAQLCAPLPQPRVELGITDPDTSVFTVIENDQTMPFYPGFQGLSEVFFTVRVTGLPNAESETNLIDVLQTATMVDGGRVLHEFGQPLVVFTELETGELELKNRRLILDAAPSVIGGATMELSVTLTARFGGREIVMEIVRQVRLEQV